MGASMDWAMNYPAAMDVRSVILFLRWPAVVDSTASNASSNAA
jgi:hypothetical protein